MLNRFAESNRNRILILDYDFAMANVEGEAGKDQEQARQELAELGKEKYSWVIMISDQPPEGLVCCPWAEDMLVLSTRGAFWSYGEWTHLPAKQASVRILLRTAVQIRSYQKGPIDYMFVCLHGQKEWAFEEML